MWKVILLKDDRSIVTCRSVSLGDIKLRCVSMLEETSLFHTNVFFVVGITVEGT
jgi:hypothetical protein